MVTVQRHDLMCFVIPLLPHISCFYCSFYKCLYCLHGYVFLCIYYLITSCIVNAEKNCLVVICSVYSWFGYAPSLWYLAWPSFILQMWLYWRFSITSMVRLLPTPTRWKLNWSDNEQGQIRLADMAVLHTWSTLYWKNWHGRSTHMTYFAITDKIW